MKNTIVENAKATIRLQSQAIAALTDLMNESFAAIVQLIHESKGRLVISGIGKSAIIAQKIAATLNSTGTPALFMHAADAIHGDLGMIQEDDIVMIISKSGESPEIKALLPLIKNFGNPVIALCGNDQSYLVQHSTYFINTTVAKEACPNNLAPTTSTTAQMVMGDALAVCLLELKGFTEQDFAKFHPGGSLGKRMYLRVGDLMKNNSAPAVSIDADLKTIILSISQNRLGATAVVNEQHELLGIITDGDLRRMMETATTFEAITAQAIMTKNPKHTQAETLVADALQLLKQYNITQLPVVEQQIYKGMIHIHDIMKEGII